MKLQLAVTALALGVATTASAVTINFNHGGSMEKGGSVGISYTVVGGAKQHGEHHGVAFNKQAHIDSVGPKDFSHGWPDFDGRFKHHGVTLPSKTPHWKNHCDDVAEVPVPGAAWLLGSSLAALVGFMRRSKA